MEREIRGERGGGVAFLGERLYTDCRLARLRRRDAAGGRLYMGGLPLGGETFWATSLHRLWVSTPSA